MAERASEGVIDFTNVKEGGTFSKKRQPAGDYAGKVTKVVDAPAKKDQVMQWLFTIEVNGETYPYYCKHEENQYWKLRNLLVAAGINVPKKKVKVDPNKVVGKKIAVTLEDDEYEGKAQSNVAATFPLSELTDDDTPDEDEATALDDDDDDTPPPPKKPKPAPVEDDDDEDEPTPPKKPKPAPVEDDDEDEDDGDDLTKVIDRTELKKIIAKEGLDVQVKKSWTEDDIRDNIRTGRLAKAKAAPDDDDDLEEIDIDDT